ncbi:MAG: PEGA domain-containing protein [Deltaproteobacteria bacterium]|nr:PEGA domain-containing protein [Deltaproteobacteria bacterium]
MTMPCLIAVLLIASPAPPDVQASVEKGVSLFEAGEFRQAEATLRRAAARAATPATRSRAHLFLGLALASLGKVAAAEAEFVAALRADPLTEVDPTRIKERLVRRFTEVREKLTGVLEVDVDRPALVRVDAATAVSPPIRKRIVVGRHLVEASSADGAWRSRPTETIVPVDGKASVVLVLEPVQGVLRLTSTPAGAQVTIDSAPIGKTPVELPIAVGSHEVRISLPSGEAWQEALSIAEGTVTERSAVLAVPTPASAAGTLPLPALTVNDSAERSGGRALKTSGIALTSLGGVGLLASGVFALLGDHQNRVVQGGALATGLEIQRAADRGAVYNVSAWGCLAGGLVSLGTGVVLLLVGHGDAPPPIAVAPAAFSGGSGVVVRGALP